MDHFLHLHSGLALILLFVGVKMIASGVYEVPIGAPLGVIMGILVAAIGASLVSQRRPRFDC